MVFVSIFLSLMIFFGIYKGRKIDDLPKKWRKIKFETRMSWNGFVGSTVDLFYRSVDKTFLYSQPDKVAVMTGGSRGIGFEVLKKLLQCDMTVVLAVRNPFELKNLIEKSCEFEAFKDKIIIEQCDVGEMDSVREFVKRVQDKFDAINVLINNAGILSAPYAITKDGFVSQMAVNYVGHFLITHLLMPQLKAAAREDENARVINVTSCVHEIGTINLDDFNYKNYYRAGMVYTDSKLAQVMFTKHLQSVCEENNWKVQTHAVHPGMVDTEIFNSSILGPLSKYPISRHWFKTPERGSQTIVHAAISKDLQCQGGSYLSNCQISKAGKCAEDAIKCQKLFEFTCDKLKIKSFGSE